MPYFKVFVEGKNFLVKQGKESGKVKFQTARYVEAENRDQAEKAGIDKIRSDNYLRGSVANLKNDPPLLYVTAITEVDSMQDENPLKDSFMMFSDTDSKD